MVLGASNAQASPQRRWQVIGLRFPWVSPAMGRSRSSAGRSGAAVARSDIRILRYVVDEAPRRWWIPVTGSARERVRRVNANAQPGTVSVT